ncbi:hypothetical protein KW798_02305 [Candidatus Parcubacteria bacterium]|nr:hypothetical protein [Candidatus Parcubacteria bacterium]
MKRSRAVWQPSLLRVPVEPPPTEAELTQESIRQAIAHLRRGNKVSALGPFVALIGKVGFGKGVIAELKRLDILDHNSQLTHDWHMKVEAFYNSVPA